MAYIILIIGFIILVKCADIFVDGSSKLAKSLGISTLIIGLTIVAFGTSAPEATVSIISSIEGKNGIAVGNIIGSNICNILLVLGVSSLFKPLTADKQIISKDFPFLLLTYILFLIFVFVDYFVSPNFISLSRKEGLLFLVLLSLYLYNLIKSHKESNIHEEKLPFKYSYIFKIIFGLFGTILGGNAVVDSATIIASSFGVSEHLIGLTIVAVGTSLPELVTSVVATIKGENDLAIGNVIGSNIFNILFILGVSSAINPLVINFHILIDLIVMTIVGLIVYKLCKNKDLGRFQGIVMIFLYLQYIIYIIMR
ncbi:MAG: calcium/sodium antiporter [Bacilli bacterium]